MKKESKSLLKKNIKDTNFASFDLHLNVTPPAVTYGTLKFVGDKLIAKELTLP